MILGGRQFSGERWLHLAAVVLLVVTQCMVIAHAANHLIHDDSEFCELFEAVEHHDGEVSSEFDPLLAVTFDHNQPLYIAEYYQPATQRHYLSRAPPAITSK